MSLARNSAPSIAVTLTVLGLFVACGGSQAPAESPEMAPDTSQPETEPPAADAGAGEHVMPDGTVMPGHEHGDGADQHGQ